MCIRDRQRGEPIGLFVEILRIWYTEAELNEWLEVEGTRARGSGEERYARRALALTKNDVGADPTLTVQLKKLSASLQDQSLDRAAMIHSCVQTLHSAARLKAFEATSNAILETAPEPDRNKVGKVFVRLFQAIANWKRTNDERELLVLSREERNLVMNLPPFEAQITLTPEATE